MKIRTTALLIPVLLALFVGTALAKTAPHHAAIDPSFGQNGKTLVSSPKFETGAAQVATTTGGETYVLRKGGFVLYAFGSNGKPDPAFGTHGRIKLPLYASDLAVDPEGRVLVVGTVSPGPNSVPGYPTATPSLVREAEVLRYLPDGSLDPSFGHDGAVRSDFGLPRPTTIVDVAGGLMHVTYSYAEMNALLISVDAAGRPIIAGGFREGVYEKDDHDYVVRLTPSGELDPSYGNGGREILPNPSQTGTSVSSLVPTPSGGVIVEAVGAPAPLSKEPIPQPSLYMLEESGNLSPSFQYTAGLEIGRQVIVDPKGRVLLPTGDSVIGSVTRLLPNGSLDPSFGKEGTASSDVIRTENQLLTTDAKGRVIVAVQNTGAHKIEVARLGTKGVLDRSFGDEGVVRVGFGDGAAAEVNAAAVDSRGRIVVAGSAKGLVLTNGFGLALTRILPGS